MFCIYHQISLVHSDEMLPFSGETDRSEAYSERSVENFVSDVNQLPNTASRKPAAIAEPITPATFGPIACIRRKFDGFAF